MAQVHTNLNLNGFLKKKQGMEEEETAGEGGGGGIKVSFLFEDTSDYCQLSW